MRILVSSLFLVLLLVSGPAGAEDAPAAEEPQPHTDAQLEEHEVFEKFEAGWERDDLDLRVDALRRLGRWRNKQVLKRLKKIWLKADEPEILAVAAEGLGHQTPFAKDATKLLLKRYDSFEKYAIPEEDEEEDSVRVRLEAAVLVSLIHAIDRLGFIDGWDELKALLEHLDDEVAGEMMLMCGRHKEYRALPILLEWFNFYPDGHSWSGGSVKVDTGAAGTKDARAAKAKWKAKYGGRKNKARPGAWEKMVQTLKMITGETFATPDELKAWMKENKVLLRKHGV